MTKQELTDVLKYIVKKCDIIINNGNYNPDDFVQDTVEDIAELCNHILDGDYGHLLEELDGWVDTGERLPEHCEIVYAALLDVQRESYQYYVGFYNKDTKRWYLNDYGYTYSVSFWMPIPKLKI